MFMSPQNFKDRGEFKRLEEIRDKNKEKLN